MSANDPYETTRQEFPEHPAEVVEQVEIDGVAVDIVRHTSVHRQTPDGPVEVTQHERVKAYRAGTYELRAPRVSWYVRDGSYHKAGQLQHSGVTAAVEVGTEQHARELSASATVKGAIKGARDAIRTEALYARYGELAVAATRTLDRDQFESYPAADTVTIVPGDLVAVYGHQRYRVAVAIDVNRGGTVRYLFATPTGGTAIGGSGKGNKVRLVKSNSTPAPAADVKVEPEAPHDVPPMRHPVEGRACATEKAAAELVAAGLPRASFATQPGPNGGFGVVDQAGTKVAPAGDGWFPGRRDALAAQARLTGDDMAARLDEARAIVAAELVAYDAAHPAEPVGEPEQPVDDPIVWVTVWRRGADFHLIDGGPDGERSGCDRHINIGNRVRRSEAVRELGSAQCSRCPEVEQPARELDEPAAALVADLAARYPDPASLATLDRAAAQVAGEQLGLFEGDPDGTPPAADPAPALVDGQYPIVVVRQQWGSDMYKPAELRQAPAGKRTAQVVYLDSRTSAWVAVGRIERVFCRVCYCTEDNACAEGCGWAEPGLCTACAAPAGPSPVDPGPPAPASPAPGAAYLAEFAERIEAYDRDATDPGRFRLGYAAWRRRHWLVVVAGGGAFSTSSRELARARLAGLRPSLGGVSPVIRLCARAIHLGDAPPASATCGKPCGHADPDVAGELVDPPHYDELRDVEWIDGTTPLHHASESVGGTAAPVDGRTVAGVTTPDTREITADMPRALADPDRYVWVLDQAAADRAAPWMVERAKASEQLWPPRLGDRWFDSVLAVTWHTRLDDAGRVEMYEPNGPGRVQAGAIPGFRGGMILVERLPEPVDAPDERDQADAVHVVELEGPDSAGHWSYRCPCGADASGFEPGEVEAEAELHGPLAADSPRPDPDEDDQDDE